MFILGISTYAQETSVQQLFQQELQEKNIFPQRWKTKMVPRLLSKRWYLNEVSNFYNAILMQLDILNIINVIV